jgi:hypothetical protein
MWKINAALVSILLLQSCSIVEKTRRTLLGVKPSERAEVAKKAPEAPVPLAPAQVAAAPVDTVEMIDALPAKNPLPQIELPENKDEQMSLLQQALMSFFAHKNDEALNQFKPLLDSKEDQIRVRAKFFTAQAYVKMKLPDRALVYLEDVIDHEGFSVYAPLALPMAMQCASTLGQEQKKTMYENLYRELQVMP